MCTVKSLKVWRKCKTDSQTVIKAAGDPGKKRSTESSARECEGGLFLFLLLMEKYTLLYLTFFTSASTSTLTSTMHSVYTMRQNRQSSFMGTKGKGERRKNSSERRERVCVRERKSHVPVTCLGRRQRVRLQFHHV